MPRSFFFGIYFSWFKRGVRCSASFHPQQPFSRSPRVGDAHQAISLTSPGYLDGDQAGWVRNEMVEVLHLIRPSAISLVDAWWVW